MKNKRLHLVLTFDWFDQTDIGWKRVEYRKMTPRWKKLIWDIRDEIKTVRFARGYTADTREYNVHKIDIGTCPIPSWDGEYYRIHFSDSALPNV
jgi:hypothetical protein